MNIYISHPVEEEEDLKNMSIAKTERFDNRDTRVPHGDLLVFNNDQFKSEIERANERKDQEMNMMLFDDDDEDDDEEEYKGLGVSSKGQSKFSKMSKNEKSENFEEKVDDDIISYLSNSGEVREKSMGFERFEKREQEMNARNGKKKEEGDTRIPIEGETRIFSI